MKKNSKRVSQLRPSAIRRMLELSAQMKDVVHLEQGEPDFATPQHILDAAKGAMEKGFTHYTDTNGTLELRQAVAEKLAKENGIDVNPKTEVTITTGSQEAMLASALGFLDPGDEALIIDPYYPAYFEDTLLAQAKPVPVPFGSGMKYKTEIDALESKITAKTKMMWFCNPSNPTGYVFSRRDLEIVADVARRHDLIVFVDEIYEKLLYDDAKHVSFASLPGMSDRTITVNGFSKAYAMTGWRIGYVVAHEDLSAVLRAVHYYATLCPCAVSQKAALAALTGPQDCVEEMLAEYRKRRELAIRELSKLKTVSYPVPHGAFYAFPDFSHYERSDERLALDILKQARVVTVPGSGFGKAGTGHLRISYSADYRSVEEGMKRMRSYLASL